MKYTPVPRTGESYLRRLLTESKPPHNVIFIEGSRQVGKTTLARSVVESLDVPSIEVNLETDPILCDEIDKTKDFKLLLEQRYSITKNAISVLFIDEAQESGQLGKYIRSIKEDWPSIRCICSGSSMKRIFRDFQ